MKSQNGWPASPTLATRVITVAGASFRIVDSDDVETVFRYIAEQYATRVEPLNPRSCFGYNYRPNVNNPTKLSNHSSGTALDINAEQHPNATPTRSTYTRAQVDACHAILASVPELAEVVHWGGDWATPLTTDAMHWEIHDHDLAKLRRVADRIREDQDMTPQQAKQLDGLTKAVAGLADMVEALAEGNDAIKRRITKAKREVLAAIEADQS